MIGDEANDDGRDDGFFHCVAHFGVPNTEPRDRILLPRRRARDSTRARRARVCIGRSAARLDRGSCLEIIAFACARREDMNVLNSSMERRRKFQRLLFISFSSFVSSLASSAYLLLALRLLITTTTS